METPSSTASRENCRRGARTVWLKKTRNLLIPGFRVSSSEEHERERIETLGIRKVIVITFIPLDSISGGQSSFCHVIEF